MGEVLLPPEDPSESELTKRTYEPPKLCSYGTLRDITLTRGDAGHPDGGTGEKDKTHV
jgi:hypothetical protein